MSEIKEIMKLYNLKKFAEEGKGVILSNLFNDWTR